MVIILSLLSLMMKKKKKKIKSGINSKAADRVKHPQRWPQAYLPFEFVSMQPKYDD